MLGLTLPGQVSQSASVGFAGWSADPALASAVALLVTGGTLYGVRLVVPVTAPVSSVVVFVTTAGTVLTSAQCKAAVFDAAGTLVDTTVDQAAGWGSTGLKTMTLAGGAATLTAGTYQVVLWFNGTIGPTFAAVSASLATALVNAGAVSPSMRYFSADTGRTTTAPATLGTQTAVALTPWVGLS